MKHINSIFLVIIILLMSADIAQAQTNENSIKLSGELLSDQRFLLETPNDWVWNENRLDLKLEKKIQGFAKFHGDIWLRNFGIPEIISSSDLYNKNIIDPYNLEVREAYVELYGLLSKNLDLKIGKQIISWGTGDQFNPTSNLNPYDLEDVLDFGRHRGTFAMNLQYYLSNDFSIQGVYIPFFQPANMPVGPFATVLSGTPELPEFLTLNSLSDTLLMPRYNLGESSTFGGKFKGFAGGFDFSLSYVWGIDGLPLPTNVAMEPTGIAGSIDIISQLSFMRNHIIGADIAGAIGSIGVWAEGAAFIPDDEVVMTTDLSAMLAQPPGSITIDSVILEDDVYFKTVVGMDYTFEDGSYLNVQYLHGFIHERGKDALNDYFMLAYEKKLFNDKLTIYPIGGGFIVSDWKDISQNYAIIFAPQIKYKATDNAEFTFAAYLFSGKGENVFVNLKEFNMFSFKVRYTF